MKRWLSFGSLFAVSFTTSLAMGHGVASSYVDIDVSTDSVRVTVAMASHDLWRAMPQLDRDQDGVLRRDELHPEALERQMTSGILLWTPTQPCRPRSFSLVPGEEFTEEVGFRVHYQCDSLRDTLRVRLRLFPSQEPPMTAFVTVYVGEDAFQDILTPDRTTMTVPLPFQSRTKLRLLPGGIWVWGLVVFVGVGGSWWWYKRSYA